MRWRVPHPGICRLAAAPVLGQSQPAISSKRVFKPGTCVVESRVGEPRTGCHMWRKSKHATAATFHPAQMKRPSFPTNKPFTIFARPLASNRPPTPLQSSPAPLRQAPKPPTLHGCRYPLPVGGSSLPDCPRSNACTSLIHPKSIALARVREPRTPGQLVYGAITAAAPLQPYPAGLLHHGCC